MFSCMGIGDLIGRLITGPVVEYFKLNVIKAYFIVQFVCALSILSFLFVVNGFQMIAQGCIFSVTFGSQCGKYFYLGFQFLNYQKKLMR